MLFVLRAIISWRKFIVLSGVLTAAAMVVVSLLLPQRFIATASVFPPETSTMMPSYAQLIESVSVPLFGPTAVGAQPASVYVDILMSRRVGERIVADFDLKRRYGAKLVGDAIGALHGHTQLTLLENGLLKIGVEDRDPEMAARIANRYVELLDEFNREINVTRASKTREFIESQMAVHKQALEEAEEALKVFQEENQTVELNEQVSSAIAVVTDLTADAITLEVDLAILGQYASGTSEEYVRKKKEYDEVLGQLKKFKIHDARSEDDFVRSFFPTLDQVPEVALELVRLQRQVTVEQKVYGMLIEEYEKARIEEARDMPTVQVLDEAVPPERRIWPKRKALVVLGGILGLAWSSFLAVLVAAWREQGSAGGTLGQLLAPIASDFRRVFRRRK